MDFSLQGQQSSRKFTGLTIVVCLHVFIAYIVATARTIPHIHSDPPPVTVLPPKAVEPLPPVELDSAKTDVKAPHVFVPAPEIPTTADLPDVPTLVTHLYPDPAIVPLGKEGVTHQAVYVPPVVDAKDCEKPDYPAPAMHQGLEGVTTLAFLIGVDGRVLGSKVEKSSGTKSLDSAALAGLSRCKFKPATVDGVAEQSWTKIQYVWKLD